MSLAAVALVLVSALLHAVWTALIKDSRDPLAFNLLQALPFLPFVLTLLATLEPGALPREVWWLLAASSVIHAAYVFWMARALERAELSLVYPVMRSTPAFLPLLAAPLLGESISAQGALGIAVVVAGMWLLHARGEPRWRRFGAPGMGFAWLVLMATVAYSLTDKAAMAELSRVPWHEPVPRSLAYFLLLGLGHSACVAPFVLRRASPRALAAQARVEWRRILLAAAGTTASYTLVLEALRSAPVSYVAAVRQASVLFAVAIGVLWLGERPNGARLAGAALTTAGVVLVSLA